jgi:hypothetical protein
MPFALESPALVVGLDMTQKETSSCGLGVAENQKRFDGGDLGDSSLNEKSIKDSYRKKLLSRNAHNQK